MNDSLNHSITPSLGLSILHLLTPGLALTWKLHWRRGLLYALSFPACLMILSWLGLMHQKLGLYLLISSWSLLWFWGLFSASSIQMSPPRSKNRWFTKIASSAVYFVLFWLILLTVIANSSRLFGWQLFLIPSESMSPTLQPGNVILSDTRSNSLVNIQAQEVLIFKHPHTNIIQVKRAVAASQDSIRIEQKKLYINNNKILDNAKAPEKARYQLDTEQYFMLGDNHEISVDSRHWGAISKDRILAKFSYILSI